MKRITKIEPKFVEVIPDVKEMKEGILYISLEFETAIHLCCCGCGEQSVTTFSEGHWKLIHWTVKDKDVDIVTLSPSIENRFACQSHYYIRENHIEWL